MTDITFENMSEELLHALPELRQSYEKEVSWWGEDDPPRHVLYAEVFNPYLIALLEAPAGQEASLRRAFDFIERLAQSQSVLTREVVAVTVFESLVRRNELWTRAERLMGSESKRIAKAVESHVSTGGPLEI